MRGRILVKQRRLFRKVCKTRINEILPFRETPSDDRKDHHTIKKDGGLAATDLFQQFTADIIQLNVTFTR